MDVRLNELIRQSFVSLSPEEAAQIRKFHRVDLRLNDLDVKKMKISIKDYYSHTNKLR